MNRHPHRSVFTQDDVGIVADQGSWHGAFVDVTSEDPDPADERFVNSSDGSVLYFRVQGHGPDGDGPCGDFDR